MTQKFYTNYTADIPLIAEFREDSIRSASHGVFEIYTVGKVGCYAHSIYYYKYPLGSHLPSSHLLVEIGRAHV